MPNYYTQFSTAIESLSEDEAAWLKRVLQDTWDLDPDGSEYAWLIEQMDETDTDLEGWPSFGHQFKENGDKPYLWVYSEESGNIEHVAGLVQAFLAKFRPDVTVSLEWAETCSKPAVDSFGGGAVVVTATEQHWFTASYLAHCKCVMLANTGPFSLDEIRQRANGQGIVTGYVWLNLYQICAGDGESFLDMLSQKLTGTDLLADIHYKVVDHNGHHDHNEVCLRVTGDVSMILSEEG